MDREWWMDEEGYILSYDSPSIFNKVADAHNAEKNKDKLVEATFKDLITEIDHDTPFITDEMSDADKIWTKTLINAHRALIRKIDGELRRAVQNLATADVRLAAIRKFRDEYLSSKGRVQVMDVSSLYPSVDRAALNHHFNIIYGRIPPISLKEWSKKFFPPPMDAFDVVGGTHEVFRIPKSLFSSMDQAMKATGLKEDTIKDLWNAGYFFDDTRGIKTWEQERERT